MTESRLDLSVLRRGPLPGRGARDARRDGSATPVSLDLAPRHFRLVSSILRRRLPGARVLAYGSRARGTARPSSDLDLLIDAGQPVDEAVLALLELDFAESDLPFRVQFVDAARIDSAFRQHIDPDLCLIHEGEAPQQPDGA